MAFDVNTPLTGAQYAEFKAQGYGAVIRYIPRKASLIAGNLTAAEVAAILGAGLSLSVVQHVAPPTWEPSAKLGELYGQYAGQYCAEIVGLPKGMNVWVDLEEVCSGCTPQDVIDYAKAWYNAVDLTGYVPGIYVGWNIKLSDQQLYALPYKHYWRSYNSDQNIPVRGFQIRQHTQKTLNGITFDPNEVEADNLEGLPFFLFPS